MRQPIRLEKGLNDLAVIRTIFETLDWFPADDPIRTEMLSIVFYARSNLERFLREVCDRIQSSPMTFPLQPPLIYQKFKAYALGTMERGYPGRAINRMMKVDVFDAGQSSLYDFEAAGWVEIEAARQMPAQQFTLLLFKELLQRASDETNYTGGQIFDRKVFQYYIAALFICYAATDPMFYGINRW